MDDDYQLLAAYPDYIQAELARGRLQAEGIDAVVFEDQFHTMLPMVSAASGGVTVMVPSRQFTQAQDVLAQDVLAQTARVSPPTCPKCGSEAIEASLPDRRRTWLSILLLGLPIGKPRTRHICRGCLHSW